MIPQFDVHDWEQLGDRHVPNEARGRPDDPDGMRTPRDDSHWDVFIPDDDEIDPLPEPGDFWIEPDE
jgi:hypothetical protein